VGAGHTYGYDDLGQAWRQGSPDTGATAYHYGAAGRRTGMTRADGTTTPKVTAAWSGWRA
jgi:YD repeat-containing protein